MLASGWGKERRIQFQSAFCAFTAIHWEALEADGSRWAPPASLPDLLRLKSLQALSGTIITSQGKMEFCCLFVRFADRFQGGKADPPDPRGTRPWHRLF